MFRFAIAGKETPLGRVLQAKKVPFRLGDGTVVNLGIDATQTKRNHNIFRHAQYQRELGMLHSVRVCYSTRVTAIRATPTSDWRLVDSVLHLPESHPTGTLFSSITTLPVHERRKLAAANRARPAAVTPSIKPAVAPPGSSPSPHPPLDKLRVSSEGTSAMDHS